MAGNTGKMTNEAIAERGPRMLLTEAREGTRTVGVVIHREGSECFRRSGFTKLRHATVRHYVWSKSYSISYLIKVGKSLRGLTT